MSQAANPVPSSTALLRRYLGPTLARYVASERGSGARLVEATAMFVDIRDFAALTAESDPTDLYIELNCYLQQLDGVIDRYGGLTISFGGDSVLAVFGAPYPHKDHACAAVQAALEIVEALQQLNEQRRAQQRPPLRVGIGVNTGPMMMGDYGSKQRKTFTVIGDAVNVAKRLSELNKQLPQYAVFTTDKTIACIQQMQNPCHLDFIGALNVRGIARQVSTFSVARA